MGKSIKQSKILKNELVKHGIDHDRLAYNNKNYNAQLLLLSILKTEKSLDKVINDYKIKK